MEVGIHDHVALSRIEPGSVKVENSFRAEIDTSAPFESVKEAVTRFGGLGYWKPTHNLNNVSNNNSHILSEHQNEELDPEKLEEQAAVMEKELILKERETLEVLKELESTKRLVENLKSKLQNEEECEANFKLKMSVCQDNNNNISSVKDIEEDKENLASHALQHSNEGTVPYSASPPGSILMELKQAKMNLNRTTNDIADVRASVEMLNKKLEKERISLEKTRERLSQNSSKISSLEEELNQTRLKLQVAKDAEIKGSLDDPSDITRELQRLSSEADHFKKMGEAARSEVMRAMSEIEQTKAMIQTAEIRLVAARKMKEAAMAAEAAAIAEIKALSHQESSAGDCMQNHDGVTLSFEEYAALTCKARDAEEHSKKRILDAMLQVDEANLSKMDILKRVEEATEEVKTSKKALEEALERVEAANKGKLAVEEALRKWRSEGQKRRSSIHNVTKFKTSYPSHHRRDSRLFDVNGLNLANDAADPVLKPTLSIGQILSRKLMVPDEFESRTLRERGSAKRKVSLGQMLGRQSDDRSFGRQVEKENGHHQQFSSKRKKFGFARFSLLLSKQQKKKKPMLNLSGAYTMAAFNASEEIDRIMKREQQIQQLWYDKLSDAHRALVDHEYKLRQSLVETPPVAGLETPSLPMFAIISSATENPASVIADEEARLAELERKRIADEAARALAEKIEEERKRKEAEEREKKKNDQGGNNSDDMTKLLDHMWAELDAFDVSTYDAESLKVFEYDNGFDPVSIMKSLIIVRDKKKIDQKTFRQDIATMCAAAITKGSINEYNFKKMNDKGKAVMTALERKYSLKRGSGKGEKKEVVTISRIGATFPGLIMKLLFYNKVSARKFQGPFNSQALPDFMRHKAFSVIIPRSLKERSRSFLLGIITAFSSDQSLSINPNKRELPSPREVYDSQRNFVQITADSTHPRENIRVKSFKTLVFDFDTLLPCARALAAIVPEFSIISREDFNSDVAALV